MFFFPPFRAYYSEILSTGASDLVSEFVDWFTYYKTPLSVIIDREHVKINDLNSFMKVMRSTNFKNDKAAQIQG